MLCLFYNSPMLLVYHGIHGPSCPILTIVRLLVPRPHAAPFRRAHVAIWSGMVSFIGLAKPQM